MAKIRWSREAEVWLKEIFDYISQDNPTAAVKVVSGIYDKAQLLSDFPELGHKYREEPEGDIRVLLYGHYRIALSSPTITSTSWASFMERWILKSICHDSSVVSQAITNRALRYNVKV